MRKMFQALVNCLYLNSKNTHESVKWGYTMCFVGRDECFNTELILINQLLMILWSVITQIQGALSVLYISLLPHKFPTSLWLYFRNFIHIFILLLRDFLTSKTTNKFKIKLNFWRFNDFYYCCQGLNVKNKIIERTFDFEHFFIVSRTRCLGIIGGIPREDFTKDRALYFLILFQ